MATLFSANFTAADGTQVTTISQSPYANFAVYSSNGTYITSNKARRQAGVSGSNNRTNESGGLSTADYSVQAEIQRLNAGSAEVFRIYLRGDSTISNCYRLTWFSNALTLARVSGGTPTTLGATFPLTFSTNTTRTIKVSATGSTLEVFIDGVSQGTRTDSTHTTAGQAGFSIEDGAGNDPTTTGFQFGTFLVETTGGGGGATRRRRVTLAAPKNTERAFKPQSRMLFGATRTLVTLPPDYFLPRNPTVTLGPPLAPTVTRGAALSPTVTITH